MAKVLKMTVVQSILSLHAQGWSQRRIAKTLAINRRTVSRYVRQPQIADSKCTSAPIEPGRLDADSKCTTAPIGSAPAAEPAPSDSCFRGAAPVSRDVRKSSADRFSRRGPPHLPLVSRAFWFSTIAGNKMDCLGSLVYGMA